MSVNENGQIFLDLKMRNALIIDGNVVMMLFMISQVISSLHFHKMLFSLILLFYGSSVAFEHLPEE